MKSLLIEVYKYIHGLTPEITEQVYLKHDNLMFSKLTYLPWTDMDRIQDLTKPTNSGTCFLKTWNCLYN